MLPTHCHRRFDVATVDDIDAVRDWAMTLAHTRLCDAARERLNTVVTALTSAPGRLPTALTLLLRPLDSRGVECLAFDRDPTERVVEHAGFIQSHHTPTVGNAHLARVWATDRAPPPSHALVDAGVVMVPHPNAADCGDGWFFRCDGADHGVALLVDGQPGRNRRARRIEAVVASTTPGLSAQMVIGAIRRDLAAICTATPSTDGATGAAAVLRLSGHAVDYTALGTVAGAMIRNGAVTSLAARWAMVGYNPQIPACVHLRWETGDHVILHSDGCSRLPVLFVERGLHRVDPTLAAAILLRDGAVGEDDQTIVVLRNRSRRQATSCEAA